MAWAFTPEEKQAILAELDRADRAGKGAIMARYEIDRREVHKWRTALAEGSLGAKRGRRKDPELEREVGRLAGLPRVLAALRRHDPALAGEQAAPEPMDLRGRILEGIVRRVDDEEVPWDGVIDADWDERVEADMLSRASRLRKKEERVDEAGRFEPGDADYLREAAAYTPLTLCRKADCPCTRFCKVQHIHPGAAGSRQEPRAIEPGDLPPAVHVCQSPRCAINVHCCSPFFGGPLHVHHPKAPVGPRLAPVKLLAEWSSVEDCPWHGRCDPRHERRDESEMEIFGVVRSTWQPVELWCLDPKCPHHRRGAPHVHCRRCDAPWPAFARDREIDLATMTRDHQNDADGLCDGCYAKWRREAERPPPR